MMKLYGTVLTAYGRTLEVRRGPRDGTVALIQDTHDSVLDALAAVGLMAALSEFVRDEGGNMPQYRTGES